MESTKVRFYKYVRVTHGCWLWEGATVKPSGKYEYGIFALNRRPILAHRAAWIIDHGDVPKGMQVARSCDNSLCVRPDHLMLVTPKRRYELMVQAGKRVLPTGRGKLQVAASVLDKRQLKEIEHRILETDDSLDDIAHDYGLSRAMITSIKHQRPRRYCHGRKLSKADVDEIVRLLKDGKLMQKDIAVKFNVHYSYVSLISRGLRNRKSELFHDN